MMDLPIGSIILWNNDDIPAGWTACDGVDAPDLRNRLIMGADSGERGDTGGSLQHNHGNQNTNTRADHNHGGSAPITINYGGATSYANTGSGYDYSSAGSHNHGGSATMASIGYGGAHSHTISDTENNTTNMPARIKKVFIKRIS